MKEERYIMSYPSFDEEVWTNCEPLPIMESIEEKDDPITKEDDKPPITRGKLFVIEGVDGSGKTTMCESLKKELKDKYNVDAKTLSIPNPCGIFSDEIKSALKGETKLTSDQLQSFMIFNMKHCMKYFIEPKLEAGTTIILDRWFYSSILYNIVEEGSIFKSFLTYSFFKNTNFLLAESNINGWNKSYPISLKELSEDFFGLIPTYPDAVFFLSPPFEMIYDHYEDRCNKKDTVDKNDVNLGKIAKLYYEYIKFAKAAANFESMSYDGKQIDFVNDGCFFPNVHRCFQKFVSTKMSVRIYVRPY
jgi:thymidylate kinase